MKNILEDFPLLQSPPRFLKSSELCGNLGLCQQAQYHPSDPIWTGSPRAMSWLCGVDALLSLTFPLIHLLGFSSSLFKMDLSIWDSGLCMMLQLGFCHPRRCKPVPCILSLCTYPAWCLNSQVAKTSQQRKQNGVFCPKSKWSWKRLENCWIATLQQVMEEVNAEAIPCTPWEGKKGQVCD